MAAAIGRVTKVKRPSKAKGEAMKAESIPMAPKKRFSAEKISFGMKNEK